MDITILDCNENGLVLEDRSVISWEKVIIFGKIGKDKPIYFLKRGGSMSNETIKFQGSLNQQKILERIAILGKKRSHIRFVVKTHYFGRLCKWNV